MTVLVVGAAIFDGAEVLAAQRGPGMSLAGRWEFPGGKVEAREDPREALVRELREELSLEVEVGELLGTGVSGSVRLDVYRARAESREVVLAEHARVAWLGAGELDSVEWAEADRPVLGAVRRILEEGALR